MRLLRNQNLFSSVVCATLLAVSTSSGQGIEPLNGSAARYTRDGELIRPSGWRKWVYVGTPLTPHDMNKGKAAFPEFHNVYVEPESFATFERSGEFPDGTQIVKELVLVGSKEAVSGNGYFMGEFAGLEVAVKDSVRFKDEPGSWAYFSFGHVAAPEYSATAKKFPTESCNSCHQASADTDFVFTQYYPVLRSAMPASAMKDVQAARKKAKEIDDATMRAAMGAVGTGQPSKSDAYSKQLFSWLQSGAYKRYPAETSVHPSSSGAAVHGDVRTYMNRQLFESMRSRKDQHPVGSVAVKELHKDGELYGWAVALKARKDDGKGNGWYWYENLSVSDDSKPVASAIGHQLCVGCHSPGRDFIRSVKLDFEIRSAER